MLMEYLKTLEQTQTPTTTKQKKQCAKHGIYTIIDLHAAPGAQNTDWHSDLGEFLCPLSSYPVLDFYIRPA